MFNRYALLYLPLIFFCSFAFSHLQFVESHTLYPDKKALCVITNEQGQILLGEYNVENNDVSILYPDGSLRSTTENFFWLQADAQSIKQYTQNEKYKSKDNATIHELFFLNSVNLTESMKSCIEEKEASYKPLYSISIDEKTTLNKEMVITIKSLNNNSDDKETQMNELSFHFELDNKDQEVTLDNDTKIYLEHVKNYKQKDTYTAYKTGDYTIIDTNISGWTTEKSHTDIPKGISSRHIGNGFCFRLSLPTISDQEFIEYIRRNNNLIDQLKNNFYIFFDGIHYTIGKTFNPTDTANGKNRMFLILPTDDSAK
ncbi:MAG: hypothetical protein PUP46_00025 [Endozoicomonas sp. (ex Botrylloides leachii)]|nr:hypothetical protein [Endozoicomonas sp. (ex Botrylloides leachii)]